MGRRISYTIWGCLKSSNDWLEWYEDIKVFFHSLKYNLTHFGITGDTYNSDKILTVSRKEKEFINLPALSFLMYECQEMKEMTLLLELT